MVFCCLKTFETSVPYFVFVCVPNFVLVSVPIIAFVCDPIIVFVCVPNFVFASKSIFSFWDRGRNGRRLVVLAPHLPLLPL